MMKKRILPVLLSLMLIINMFPSFALALDTDTNGVYQISTAQELEEFRNMVNNGSTSIRAVLLKDIDLGGSEENQWTPIGNYSKQFTGSFDGGGFEITGLYINSTSDCQGLFGFIGSGGTVANLGVSGTVSGSNIVGGVAGINRGTISNCYSTVTVSGLGDVGGVAGMNYGTIENCYNTGAVSGDFAGGVAGDNYGTIENCYNTGAVSGSYDVGGVAGYNDGTIENCYNTGDITVGDYVGGVAGENNGTTTQITNCYYLENTANGGVDGGGHKLSAAEFKDKTNFENWDFDTVWGMSSTLGRPVLQAIPESAYFKGGGTKDSPYLIPDLATLEYFRDYINAGNGSGEYFKQTNTIDLSSKYGKDINGEEVSWTPIGNSSSKQFTGNYDGGGFEITGLYINSTGSNYQGLFGYIGSGGTVVNLSVSGEVTAGGQLIGGVAGDNYGTIKNCYNTVTVSGNYDVGGVAGGNDGTIENCYSTGDVTGSTGIVGGVAGYNDGTIENCYNTGAVNSSGIDVGGVAGWNYGTITNCYNTGAVSGSSYVGGVAGLNSGAIESCYNIGKVTGSDYVGSVAGQNWGTIENCYNTGAVSGSDYVGGVVGWNAIGGTIKNCYNTGAVNGSGEVGGVAGINDGTIENCYYLAGTADGGINGSDTAGSAEVLTKAKFKVSANFTDWDFDTVWGMETLLGRPVLKSIPEKFDPQAAFNGEGTKDSPYRIPDLETLELFRDYINAGYGSGEYFEQTATIDLSSVYSSTTGTSWTPIGNYSKPFTGNYNGGGFEITGLYINSRSGCQGLFGYIGSGGVVANLGVSGEVNGDGDYCVGGVAGENDGTIENCYNTGAVSGSSSVGGVTGLNWGTIENCYNTGAVSGSDYVGGVTGISMGTIKNSYNTGDVTGSGSSVGGVAGQSTYGTIKNSYNTGAVSSSSVSSGSRVGGVAGYSDNNIIENCYYLENTADGGISGSDAAGSAEVLTAEQFKDKTNFENWDFNTVWGMNLILGRPVLQVIPEAGYFKGEGTKDSPYLIPDLATLEYFRDYINAGYGSGEYFEQTATIDMSSKYGKDINGKAVSWTPIGNSSKRFTGNYNGGGFEITGLYINSTSDYQGLFGYIGSGGTVANLGVSGTVSGSNEVGGVAGVNRGTIENCYNTGAVNGSGEVGGVAGINDGTIENCYNTGAVSGSDYVGGVTGISMGTIKNSYNTGDVTGSGSWAGGVAGSNNYATIKNCYNTGKITGRYYVGGVAGSNYATIENCYYLENTANGGINGKDTSGAAVKSAEAFAGGEVCWLLNGSTSIGELAWYQNIDNGETPDESPKFTGGIVYMNADGDYTNTPQIEFNSDVPVIISIVSGEKAEIALSDYIANADAVGGVSFAAGDLPEGLALDSDSAAITGTCTAPGGNYTITITVIAGNSETDERQLELTLLVTSYTAIIPKEITADGTEVEIGAEDVILLDDNKQLTFSISESSVFTLKNEQNISLDYTVTKDSAEVSPGGTFLSLTQDGTCNLLFTADKPKYSGKYTGTVTFIISVEEVQSS